MAFDGTTPCWYPAIPINLQRKVRLNIAKFGDGYEQRQLDGINFMNTEYGVTFDMRPRSVILSMDSYLQQRLGHAFGFYDPVKKTIVNVFCDEWTVNWVFKKYDEQKNRSDFGTLTANFRAAYGETVN